MATHGNHGDRQNRNEQVQSLLSDAVTSLCQKLLMYNSEMCIEGLLGITLDQKDIVLVNIREVIKEASSGVMLHKPHAADTRDRTFPQDSSPVPDPMEVVDVTDTSAVSHGSPSKQRCFESTQRRVSCEASNTQPQSNHNVNAPVRVPTGEQKGGEEGIQRRQGGNGTDWVSDIIHNTIGPGKDTDFEAGNESPINLDASLYDDPSQSVNYTAMSVAMDTIRVSDSNEMRRCGPVVVPDVSTVNGEATTNRILLPEPIMQTEKQVSHCDSKCMPQQPVLVMPGVLRNDVRNVTLLTGGNTHGSHNTDSMTSGGHTNNTGHNTDSMTYMGHTNITGHNTNNMTSESHTNTSHSDKVKVKMEPLDNAALSHLVGLTNLDPKVECAYTCHLCRRAFSHKRTLMRHQRTHHLGQKHFCPFCNKPFGRKDTMRRHSLMYHPMAACSQMSLHDHIPIHSSLQ